jgi:hypothetical protein
MRQLLWIPLAGALALAGCRQVPHQRPEARTISVGCETGGLASRLDRGDWEVEVGSSVWKVYETQRAAPARHRGYLVAKRYRQARGGPDYTIYTVTTLNRREVRGRVDQVGRAWRYVPRRDMGFDQESVGANTLENNVAAILGLPEAAELRETTERRLAFEALDRNKDGLLQMDELRVHGDRVARADTNRDGLVDFAEFDAIDVL